MPRSPQGADTVNRHLHAADRSAPSIAHDGLRLLLRWYALLEVEISLARQSLRALLFGTLLLPVLVIVLWSSLIGMLTLATHALIGNWLAAMLLVAGLQLVLTLVLLRRLRSWWHDLSLPQSRAALQRALQRLS